VLTVQGFTFGPEEERLRPGAQKSGHFPSGKNGKKQSRKGASAGIFEAKKRRVEVEGRKRKKSPTQKRKESGRTEF